MSRTISRRSVWWPVLLSMDVLVTLVLIQTSAMAADISALFQEARSTAVQLNRDAAEMESYTRSNVNWQTHGARIIQIKEHVNRVGSILSQMEAARGSAQPWHQAAIDGITPLLKQLASNTESIINHLNENPGLLKDPTYVQYLKSNAQSASELSNAVGNIVDYDNTKTSMQELVVKMGRG